MLTRDRTFMTSADKLSPKEASVVVQLKRLLSEGQNALADQVADRFLNEATEARKRIRAQALLRIAGGAPTGVLK